MSLRDQLTGDLKTALKSSDETRKGTLRLLLAALKQAEIDKRPAGALDEGEVLAVIQKEAKSRRESIADAQKANRADLVAMNETELHVIESYLPKQLTREELVELARAAIAETGAGGPQQMGAVMKLLTPRTKGRADGKLVSDVVRELLSP
ncbi:MAG: hypothetical protein A2W37_12320 [Chloroflexi bacterium RBG_16_63_12]|jgi:hypothetical protein|nr:Transamidase GatB domain protein [Anaerolineales bacterium]MBM2848498.1 Transamidase GatB domain protein [Anaerolineales bacterium]OGO44444.1 MAG: hypothetical protein A2W37_12320 [Chloroflexi bacterium RBG_16_63_12]